MESKNLFLEDMSCIGEKDLEARVPQLISPHLGNPAAGGSRHVQSMRSSGSESEWLKDRLTRVLAIFVLGFSISSFTSRALNHTCHRCRATKVMISSAVAIPEQPPTQPPANEESSAPSSPSRKRRQSSPQSPDTNKRPRLDTSQSNGNQISPPPSAASFSPTNRKPSLVTPVEEKKRNQRLFSGLLSTLSQTSSSKAKHSKRDEIEARQRERLRKDTEEREDERRRRRAETDERRRSEQKRWEMEGRELDWQRRRAMAGFLKTEAEPSLYWRPWEMREDEKRRVEKQKDEVEAEIRHEQEELGLKSSEQRNGDRHGKSEEEHATNENVNGAGVNGNGDEAKDGLSESNFQALPGNDDATKEEDQTLQQEPSSEAKAKDDDHVEEELVEGEDQVIY